MSWPQYPWRNMPTLQNISPVELCSKAIVEEEIELGCITDGTSYINRTLTKFKSENDFQLSYNTHIICVCDQCSGEYQLTTEYFRNPFNVRCPNCDSEEFSIYYTEFIKETRLIQLSKDGVNKMSWVLHTNKHSLDTTSLCATFLEDNQNQINWDIINV